MIQTKPCLYLQVYTDRLFLDSIAKHSEHYCVVIDHVFSHKRIF
jgi:hypothetical protein